jgi:hypothetical protein
MIPEGMRPGADEKVDSEILAKKLAFPFLTPYILRPKCGGPKKLSSCRDFCLDFDAAVTILRTLFRLFGFNWTEKREERLKRQNQER